VRVYTARREETSMTDVPLPSPVPPPPPLPAGDDRPPGKKRSVLLIVLIVAGVLAIPCIAGLVGTVAIIVPQMKEKQHRFTCQNNLSQLGGLYVAQAYSGEAAQLHAHSGPAFFLAWRLDGSGLIREGQESVFLCPGDPEAHPRPQTADWDSVDLANPPRELCSYAARDFAAFPLDPHPSEPQVIGACLHHKGGVNVLYDDGAARFLTLMELGVIARTDISVGPQSKVELLRPLKFYE
jgi:hypothetical protein